MLDDSRYRRTLRMLSKMPRPSRTAATMVAKLSSARIILAASFVTSVPVRPIATPMSADFSAGASFTPSPVIATTLPSACRASTIFSLCSGATRAYTEVSRTVSRHPCASSLLSSSPVRACAPGSTMPRSAAILAAVMGWSPVIIITRIPARRASAMAVAASARGGSMIPTTPRYTSCSSSASLTSSSMSLSNGRYATPSVR